MCAIVGMIATRPQPRESQALLRAMRDTMAHRGPDGAGEWWSTDFRVGFGHRRLAILDLSPRGHQPMLDGNGNWCVTFNGEIYNYQSLRDQLEAQGHVFVTRTDTEVILKAYRAWGDVCLSKLDGMFAFALFDATKNRVLLARDRAGEKPLFYRQSSNGLVFASELKAIMANPDQPRKLDLRGLEQFLAFGYVAGECSILENVKKMPAAHAGIYDLSAGSFQIWRYWELPNAGGGMCPPSEELERQLEDLLQASVKRQMVADVPVGILLSGGIDSSLVVAMAARENARVKTFTVAFPGHKAHDESASSRLVARHFGTDHTELPAEEATVDLLPQLARQYDEPLGDSSMVPTYMVSRLIRQHATVALGGDGGDELFGGYQHYGWLLKHNELRRYIPALARRALGFLVQRFCFIGFPARNYLIGFGGPFSKSIAHINMFFDSEGRRRIMVPPLPSYRDNLLSPEALKEQLSDPAASPLRQATTVDFRLYLPDDILAKVDRASMLTSLEVRSPWLDRKLIEFAFSKVPDCLCATKAESKILPRRLASRLLPAELHRRPKQGFSIPFGQWFRGNWGPLIEDIFAEADEQIWNRKALRVLLGAQRWGFGNAQRIFAVTMFELWRREYRIGV
jgi:asparagine synthase (glutamine-hydrolysing)